MWIEWSSVIEWSLRKTILVEVVEHCCCFVAPQFSPVGFRACRFLFWTHHFKFVHLFLLDRLRTCRSDLDTRAHYLGGPNVDLGTRAHCLGRQTFAARVSNLCVFTRQKSGVPSQKKLARVPKLKSAVPKMLVACKLNFLSESDFVCYSG